MLPFLMIREEIAAVKRQIVKEGNDQKYHNFCEVLNSPEIKKLLGNQTNKLESIAFSQYGSAEHQILALSLEQSALLLSQIGVILSFDGKKIAKCKLAIKK